MEHNCKTCDFFQWLNDDADEISGYCESDSIDGYVSLTDRINCPHWKSAIHIKQKKITFADCPFRLKDEIYKNIGYCSLIQDYCDIYVFNNLPKQCPLFEEVN